ncbi:MutS protein msh4 [Tulasnella sp. 425]|nr:MutS protein msh4 [Tulasnella sp. 425]
MPTRPSTSSTTIVRPQSTASGLPPRPPSARPPTAASNREAACTGDWVVSVIEGRGEAEARQLADCQTYVKTIHHIHLHYPAVIIIPDTFNAGSSSLSAAAPGSSNPKKKQHQPSLLLQCLQEEFEDVAFETVGRKYFNDSAGKDFVTQLVVNDDERAGTLLALGNKLSLKGLGFRYYALSAASALFKYTESRLNVIFATQSLRIKYRGVEGTMMIDTDTAVNLELVGNRLSKRSSHSLFGLLNHCFTPMATRLLRVNILAPITVQSSIDARLDAVEELINTEEKYTSIKDSLKTLKKIDLDKLVASLTTSESRASITPGAASFRVRQMLDLRSVIRSLPTIAAALQGCRSQLLQVVAEMVSDERIAKIDERIGNTLNQDANVAKGSAGLASLNSRVFAVRANYDRLLDVARETYKENVGDILDLCKSLASDHELPFTPTFIESAGGFWLTIRKDEVQGELPRGCINVTSKGVKWKFTTLELKKRNSRMKDSLDETLLMSDRIIQGLVAEIIDDIGALYKASEAIALLDMLWSFAHVSILNTYVRPEFTGTLAIKGGRHPVLEKVLDVGVFVPNDAYICDASTFQIIHGPNMSGKSTYLRQIGVMTVLAMCGCFVPSEYASFRVHDALLSRLATDKSLVLIDELGRGTAPQEGIGISHAIAEELIRRKPTGLELARLADLPPDVLTEARRVAERLSEMEAERREASPPPDPNHSIPSNHPPFATSCASMSNAARNPDSRPLPPGWITQYDKNYDAWFYVNTAATPPVTTWEHPGQNAYAPPPVPPPGPPPSNQYNQGYSPGYNQGGQYPQQQQPGYFQQSPPPQQYAQQQSYGNDRGPGKSGGGLLGKLLGGGSRPSSSTPSYGGGYGPQPGYGGYGPGPSPGYYGQQPMYAQPAQKSGGGMGMGTVALAAGGGLVGGMLLADAFDDSREDAYADGYNDGQDGGGFDGDF